MSGEAQAEDRRARISWPLFVALAAVAVLAGCSEGGATSPTARPGATPRLAVVIKGLDNPFFVAMKEGIDAESTQRKVQQVTVQAATDIEDSLGQARKLTALTAGNYDCYVVNPINQTNLVGPLVPVSKAGRPIVDIDSPISSVSAAAADVRITSYIGTDNVAAGALGAEAMATALGGRGGSVVLVGGFAGDAGSAARLAGFRRAASGLSLRVVSTVAANFNFDRAQAVAARILHGRRRVDGFFAANDVMALGIAQAARSAHRPLVKVIGVDGIPDALQAVKAGSMTATVSQYPFVIGKLAVEGCIAATRGSTLPARVDAPTQVVTRANVDQAITNFPRPVTSYEDPFAALIGR